MRKPFSLLLLSAALVSGSVFAAPVLLGTVAKDYGSDPGKDTWAGQAGTCDTLNANSITITDTGSGCQRFWDTFDFSAFDYDSIDHFELTLTYSDIGAPGLCIGSCTGERWAMRPASSGTVGSSNQTAYLSQVGATPTTTTFTISNSNYADVFSTIVNQGVFHLWFAESSAGTDTFNLYNASLGVFGETTVVPLPAAVWLFGSALGLLPVLRRLRLRVA